MIWLSDYSIFLCFAGIPEDEKPRIYIRVLELFKEIPWAREIKSKFEMTFLCFMSREMKKDYISSVCELSNDDKKYELSYTFYNRGIIIMDYSNWTTIQPNDKYQLYVLAHETRHLFGKPDIPLKDTADFIKEHGCYPIMYQATKGIDEALFDPKKSIELEYF